MGLDNRVARQKDELLPIINPPRSEELPPEHVIQVKRVTEIITSMMTIDEHERLFEHVAHKAAALFRAEDCSLFWINRERRSLSERMVRGKMSKTHDSVKLTAIAIKRMFGLELSKQDQALEHRLLSS